MYNNYTIDVPLLVLLTVNITKGMLIILYFHILLQMCSFSLTGVIQDKEMK